MSDASTTPIPPSQPSGCFRMAEFLAWSGISKTKAYDEIKAGRLRKINCGRCSLIRVEDALRWRDALPATHVAPEAGERQPKARRAKLSVVSAGGRAR